MLSSILLDVSVLVILIICAIYYYKKGFASGLFNFVGTLAAVIASVFLAVTLASAAFDALLRQSMVDKTQSLITEHGIQNLRELLNYVVGFLPAGVLGTAATSLGSGLSDLSVNMSTELVDKVIAPLIIPFIALVMFLICFMFLRFLFGLISKGLRTINHIPLVGSVNKILGLAIGVLIGLLYTFVILCVFWGIDAMYGGGHFASGLFADSIVYRLFGNLNVFLK